MGGSRANFGGGRTNFGSGRANFGSGRGNVGSGGGGSSSSISTDSNRGHARDGMPVAVAVTALEESGTIEIFTIISSTGGRENGPKIDLPTPPLPLPPPPPPPIICIGYQYSIWH